MTIVKGDPSYLDNKDKYFIEIAKAVEKGSNHPLAPGGCVIVRDREIIGDGRSCLAHCKVEIECISYAIAVASKRGTPLAGATVYSTRYPFSAAVHQLHLMGIKKVLVLSRGEWENHYKDEFHRAARLGHELNMNILPYYEDADQRFTTNTQAPTFNKKGSQHKTQTPFKGNPIESDDFDIEEFTGADYESDFTVRP